MYAKFNSLEDYYNWHGENGDPAPGTVNCILGYSTNNPNTHRYTQPLLHEDATYDCDIFKMPIKGTVQGEQKVYAFIDDVILVENPNLTPSTIITNEEYNALNWQGAGDII